MPYVVLLPVMDSKFSVKIHDGMPKQAHFARPFVVATFCSPSQILLPTGRISV